MGGPCAMARIAIVIPCYNEEERLDVAAFRSARLDGHRLELVFVDDGSRDGTRSRLEEIRGASAGGVRIVAYDENQGKAEAVRRGVLDAVAHGPDAVGYWDADLATPLGELPAFVDILESRPEIDIVMGSRVKLMGRDIERNPWRHYAGRLFATAASIALRLPVYDTQCGAKLFRATPLLRSIFDEPFVASWVFDVEILARFMSKDPRGADRVARSIYELPLRTWVDIRGSKLRTRDFAKAAADLVRIRARYPPKGSRS
jgi:dolichyl-phosphate beta-glucosyltransferase